MFNITCEMCGETFEAKSKLARYCEECKIERRRQRHAVYRERKRMMAKEAARKGCDIRNISDRKYFKSEIRDANMIDIAKIAKEARKLGMTYGQFVARGRCV